MLEGAPPGGLAERLLALRGFSMLAALPAAELALVARLSREREYRAGETLATEGDPVQTVQLIVSGGVTLSRAGAAVQSAGAWETVGLLPLAAGLPHPFTAVTAEPVHALEIDADLVAEALEDNFALFARVLQFAAAAALAASRAGRQGLAGPNVTGASPGHDDATVNISPRRSLDPLDAAERLLALRNTTLFRAAPVDGLAAFAKRLELVPLSPGTELRTGATGGDLLVVVAGLARVAAASGEAASDASGGLPTRDVGAGVVLGALEALANASPSLCLRALTPVQLLRGTVSDLFDVLEDHHAMGRRLLAAILQSPPVETTDA